MPMARLGSVQRSRRCGRGLPTINRRVPNVSPDKASEVPVPHHTTRGDADDFVASSAFTPGPGTTVLSRQSRHCTVRRG
jgi:hypothetical protein